MAKQYQHIVPQVYMKGFGFQKPEFGNKWFVSVKNIVKNKWEDREIRRFLGENNLYDLTTNQTVSNRILEEELHGGVEKRFKSILEYLDNNTSIHRAIHMDIAETTANFLCRSKMVLEWIERILEIKPEEFWKNISDENGVVENKKQQDELYERLMQLPKKDRINNFMLFFMLHIKLILCNAQLTIFKNPDDLLLFTGGNTVLFNEKVGYGEIAKKDMEAYFAIDKNYLAYFYWTSETTKLESIKPFLINDTIQELLVDHIEHFCKEFLFPLNDEFIIAPLDKSLIGK